MWCSDHRPRAQPRRGELGHGAGQEPLRRTGGSSAGCALGLCAPLLLAVALMLSACGFKLRGAPSFAFDTITVAAVQAGPVAAELRRALGDKLVATAPPAPTALTHVTLDILQEQREKTVVGVNAAGQVREFQLRIRVRFRLRATSGKDLIEDAEILQQRDISFNESAVLAKEVEEGLLYRDMQSDIVQQLMRRLAAVKSPT